jgi:hypothetical protein
MGGVISHFGHCLKAFGFKFRQNSNLNLLELNDDGIQRILLT